MREGWSATSHVDGTVDVERPAGSDLPNVRQKLAERIRSLGYEPTFVSADSGRTILFHTPETLAQRGQGGHGFPSSDANGDA